MVAISIPIPIFKMLGGTATDDQITTGILIQTTNDIEHGGLTAAGGAEDGYELIPAEAQRNAAQGPDGAVAQGSSCEC